MNAGVTAMRLIDCMAAMPWAGCRRARAFITKLEKAKKTPALSPQPRAVATARAASNPSIVVPPQAAAAEPLQTPVAAAARA
jgi:hypothetical protein